MPISRYALLAPALVLISAGLATSLEAQSRVELGRCTEESKKPSFLPTAANQLSADQFVAKIVEQRIVYQRVTVGLGDQIRGFIFFRAEHSLSSGCTPCSRKTDEGGSRDVGVWRIADPKGVICLRRTGVPSERDREQESCFTFHESGGQFAMQNTGGPGRCLPGNFEIKPPGG